MAVYDVIVLGLGGMGSAAAYHLARRRVRVLGLEQYGVAHELGSSHGRTRLIRQAYLEGPDYVPLVLRAYDLWRELEREAGQALLTITGNMHIGTPDAPTVAGAELSASIHHIPYEMLTSTEIHTRFPVVYPPSDNVALVEPGAGILAPERCVAAHIKLAQRYGADLHFQETVESWSAGAAGVQIRTSRETYEAGQVIIATGAWAAQVLRDIDLPLQVERQVFYWFEPKSHLHEFRHLPALTWEDDSTYFYSFPYFDGQGLKCGFHHSFGEITTPQTIRRKVGDDEKVQIREYLGKLMPDAVGTLLATATCMYTNTPDRHFIIDKHPQHDNVTFACGFSGHGFKFCTVVGEVLADLALVGQTPRPIGLFSLRRFDS